MACSVTGVFPPDLLLKENEIYLQRITPEDYFRIWKERKKEGFERETCRPVTKRSEDEARQWIPSVLENEAVCVLGVYIKENGKQNIAGQLTLSDYNPRNRSMELGYSLLPPYRRKGCMSRALKLVLKHLFMECTVNKLYAQTGSFNAPSIALLESLGFHCDGRLRQHHELNGTLYDDYIYSLICSDWKAANISKAEEELFPG